MVDVCEIAMKTGITENVLGVLASISNLMKAQQVKDGRAGGLVGISYREVA